MIKWTLVLLSGLLSLLLLYVLFNLDIFHHTTPLTKREINTYTSHIDTTGPLDYIAGKFDSFPVVMLGELHKRKQDLDFFKALIPYLWQKKGVKTIGWEFGAADFQKEADSIVIADAFDREKAIAVMRRSNYFWCYEDYLDVFKTVWQLNKTIKEDSNKVRFLQLNKPYVPRRWNSPIDTIRLDERKMSFDNILPSIVEKEVFAKNKKILIYCGLHHSLSKFKTPKFFFLRDNDGRAGQILLKNHPGKIFQVCLLSPFPPRWLLFNHAVHGNEGKYVYPFGGVFNQLADTLKRPFAIDAANPVFADLEDHDSFYAFDNAGGLQLNDFCDALVMLSPFENVEPVGIIPDWVTSIQELEAVKNVLPEQDAAYIKTISDLTNYINPVANQQEIRKIHQLKRFW